MVKSKIYPEEIIYKEDKTIDDEDIGYASTLYSYTIFGIPLEIALGKEKYKTSSSISSSQKHDVVYYPIYLILHDEPKAKIGVFEVESHRVINIMDDEGDLDLTQGNVIIYATEKYLRNIIKTAEEMQSKKVDNDGEIEDIEKEKLKGETADKPGIVDLSEDNEEEDEEADVMRLKIPDAKLSAAVQTANTNLQNGIFAQNTSISNPPTLPEENAEESNILKLEYQESSKNTWIQKFTKNAQYGIIDNEGAGDCFFAVVRDAFHQIGKDTTVNKLRSILSKEATEDLFKTVKTLYFNFLAEFQEREKELKTIKKSSDILKKRIDNSEYKNERKQIIDEAKLYVDKFKKTKDEKEEAKEILDEYIYAKDIESLEQMREFILTRNYWADTWAISTLERLLNVKIIILSEEAYKHGDVDSVMQCGQLNDPILETAGNFKPDYYIITCYTGRHYKLVTYKEKNIFTFREIPYDIKALVVNKCMERNAGPYNLIKDFNEFKTKLGYINDENDEENEDEYLNKDIYDKDIVFVFHANSNAKPKSGMGSGEQIPSDNRLAFNALNKITDWRKMLDDSWAAPFTIESTRWNTVEHYFLGSQFKKGFPDFYQQFSLDSGSDISKDLELAKAAGGKSGKLKDRILRESKIKMDPDFYEMGVNPRNQMERKKALTAKFSQNLDLKDALLNTQQAKLVHFIRGKEPEPDIMLMKLRKELQQVNGVSR